MTDSEQIVSSSELKWRFLIEATKKRRGFMVRYDDIADMVMILFTPPELETAVFYADGHVGLLVDPDTMNVVGFQIEAFKRSFLKEHDEVSRVWNLSETNIQPEEFSDFVLRFEKMQRNVAREIIRATEDVVDDDVVEDLVAALA